SRNYLLRCKIGYVGCRHSLTANLNDNDLYLIIKTYLHQALFVIFFNLATK
ncbi:MAG: hypothetical protein ACI9ES_001031, partial [Oceanospirillaceae bacterium]